MWDKDRRLALDLTVLVLFLFECVSMSSVQSSQGVWQYAVLYMGDDGTGEPFTIMEEENDKLESLGFGKAKSQCHVGAWVICGSNFSESYLFGKALYASGCRTGDYSGKSIRFAGDPSNYTRDALTLFEDRAYGKHKEVLYNDGNVKMSLVYSMIATGSSDWSIYKDPNYGGESYCLKFKYDDYSHFILQLDGKPFANSWISSVKKGCLSSSVIKLR